MFTEEELIRHLEAPVKSFRLFAIEEIIQKGASETLLNCLQKVKAEETDEECLLLLSHAVDRVKKRLSKETPVAKPDYSDPKIFIEEFAKADTSARLTLLKEIPRKVLSAVTLYAPEWLEKETNPIVAASIIKTFGRTWPQAQFNAITARLLSGSFSVRIACLEVIVQIAPLQLKNALPKLLISEDPRTRALAVTGLAAIDPDEALLHLDSMLMSPNINYRIAGLQFAFSFSIDQVKTILLKFLATENDPKLLEKAGWIFLSNPDLETPYRLWKIVESSPKEKSLIVKKIVTELCKIIKDAGLVKGDFSVFLKQLQDWIFKREALRFVQSAIQMLSTDAEMIDPELESNIVAGFKRPEIRTTFVEALEWPVSERAKDRLKSLLGIAIPQKAQEPPKEEITEAKPEIPCPAKTPGEAHPAITQKEVGPAKPGPEIAPDSAVSPQTNKLDEAIARVENFNSADAKTASQEIEKFIMDSACPADLRAAALRAAIKLDLDRFSENAEKNFSSKDSNLVTASMEYLAKFDIEKFFLQIGTLLQRGNQRIKITALKILESHDPREALSRITAMLKLAKKEQKLGALECMMTLDFSLVRELLRSFLEENPTPDYLNPGLCVFASNPDPENFYHLYHLERKLPPEFRGPVENVTRETWKILEKQGVISSERKPELDKANQSRYEREEEKKKAGPSPYSLKTLSLTSEPPTFKAVLLESMHHPIFLAVSFGFLSMVALWFIFSEPPVSKPLNLAGEKIKIQGRILARGIEPGELILQAKSGSKYLIEIDPKKAKDFKESDAISAELVPYRALPDGSIVSRLESMAKTGSTD